MTHPNKTPQIGMLAEKPVHAAIKTWYARPGDQLESPVDRYVIDILRGEQVIEIQTAHLYKMRRKVLHLTSLGYQVHLLYPLPSIRWIIRETQEGERISRRKSPKKGHVEDVFRELARFTDILKLPGFSLEVVFVEIETHWRDDGQGSWRRKGWSLASQELLAIEGTQTFSKPQDYRDLLPDDLPQPFTNRILARALRCPTSLAQKTTYTLRTLDLLKIVGKQGNEILYTCW